MLQRRLSGKGKTPEAKGRNSCGTTQWKHGVRVGAGVGELKH